MKLKVFNFTNYREYLRAWDEERKASPRPMSIRQFARKAKISSPNYFQRVLREGVKLSDETIEKFVTGLGLAGKEAEYFRALVRFNQCEDAGLKIQYLRDLERLGAKSEIREIQSRNLFKNWFYPVIWELATCKDLELTPEAAVQALNQSITKKEAREAISFLETNGYLERVAGTNRFTQPSIRIQSADEVANLHVQLMHRKFAESAAPCLELPISEREFQGITIALSPEKLQLAKRLIKTMTRELVEALANDPEADQVYRINLQLFPVTQKVLNPQSPKKGVVPHENPIQA